MLLITFKAKGLGPKYTCELLTPYEPDRRLRSSGKGLLAVPRSRLVTRGDRAFDEFSLTTFVSTFKSLLKTN